MKKIALLTALCLVVLAGCKKADFDETITGEAINSFTLTAPATNQNLLLNAATPDAAIEISWSAAKPGVSTQPVYKWVAALKSAGDFNAPLLEIPSDNGGKANKLTLTHKKLDDALKAKGIADGAKTDLIWTIVADNTTTQLKATDVWNMSVTRMKNGATPFILLGPAPATNAVQINPTSTTDKLKFNWRKSTPAAGSPAVTYKVLFSKTNDFTTPLFSILSNNKGADSLLEVTSKQLNDSLVKYGYADLGVQANLQWTVVATSGTWQQQADYINAFPLTRQVSFFLVGSVNGWDINNPLALIADKKPDRYGKVFYTYIKLSTGDAFKFFSTKGDWGSGYGDNGTSATPGGFNTGYNVGGDFHITTDGIYRLTIDVQNNLAYVQQKSVGMVGSLQGWNETAPVLGGYLKRDRFLIIGTTNGADEFKFHDGTAWDNSAPGKSRWWGKGSADGLLDLDGGGANLPATGNPRTRAIWDGTDPQTVKYLLSPAVEMRVVGNGIQGVAEWNPGASPQMTYIGNGKWQITLNLISGKNFKFLSGNDWGAFDYEDAGGGKINYDGGGDFATPPVSGSYTITLDEYNGTYTIL
jgi:starch-binding outer membrane protein SusE/F